MKIAVASDHAGFEIKEKIRLYLESKGHEIHDFGAYTNERSDYPDFGHLLADDVSKEKSEFGISVCGSGNGINMTANKYPKIRSALCWNDEIAKLARAHNDANVCALPGRFINFELAKKIVDNFLNTAFEGGRHVKRVKKIPLKRL